MNLNQFSLSSQKQNQHGLLIWIFSLIYYPLGGTKQNSSNHIW